VVNVLDGECCAVLRCVSSCVLRCVAVVANVVAAGDADGAVHVWSDTCS